MKMRNPHVWITLIAIHATATLASSVESTPSPPLELEVNLRQGRVLTLLEEISAGRVIYSLRGLPYAEPPVGELRLKEPIPMGTWAGVRNATSSPPECPQLTRKYNNIVGVVGEEDCLYLNVYTPKHSSLGDESYEPDLPVMVWFHGGGFKSGGGDVDPTLLLQRDIVLVTVQYRLGLLGFLSTEDSLLPGNLGLKDQNLALHWVKANIRELGGDPDKVTIFGESAGAASVHYHILSPMSEGLFTRAIMQSGSALCPWALASNHLKMAVEVMLHLNCSDASFPPMDSVALLKCIQEAPLEELLMTHTSSLQISDFAPRIDGTFLPDHPAILLKTGKYNKVDIITGTTRDEGASFAHYFLAYEDLRNHARKDLPSSLTEMLFLENAEAPEYLAKRIIFKYIYGYYVTRDQVGSYVELFGHRFNIVCQDQTALLHAETSPNKVFVYEFGHRGSFSFGTGYGFGLDRISHGDDVQYLFDNTKYIGKFMPRLKKDTDLFVSYMMVTMWTNFVVSGHPTPDQHLGFRWTPMSNECLSGLKIQTIPEMFVDSRQKVREFWNKMALPENLILHPEYFMEDPPAPQCPRV